MISLRRTATDMELLEESLRNAEDYYTKIIRACGDCAVEFDRQASEELQEQLRSVETQFKRPPGTYEFRAAYEFTRNQLDLYQQTGGARINAMRQELAGAAAALKEFAEGVSSGTGDHEVQLRREIRHLENLANSQDLAQVREGVLAASAAILASHEQLERSQRQLIAQLKDEIRALHNAFEDSRKPRYLDQASGAWTRQRIAERMDVLLKGTQPFCVLALEISNWPKIQNQYSPGVRQNALRALLATVQKLLGNESAIGRWSDDLFLAVIEVEPSALLSMSAELKRKIPSLYTVPHGTSVQTVKLETTIGIVDRRAGVDAGRFYLKLKQITEALGG